MKTKHIALTLLAGSALMFSACVNENEINGGASVGKNDIAFRISTVQTRAEVKADALETIEVGSTQTSDGDVFILEENVQSLDRGLATRGTPAFTENVDELYDNKFNAYCSSLGDAAYEFDGETWWTHHYAGVGDLFPEGENKSYQFFLRMPGDIASGNYGLTSAPKYNNDGSIEFDYKTPDSASGQTDILFTSKTITKNEEEVYFYHVLTGVKFQNFYTNKDIKGKTVAKTKITSVTISGLKNTGSCKVTPAGTTAGSSANVSVWTIPEDATTGTYTQAFTDTTNYTGGQYGLNTLLNTTASARNLNDNDGSLTFWFIPQDITKVAKQDSVVLTVQFDVYVGETKTHSAETLKVNLSDVVAEGHRVWKAGELHTFTLKPTTVGVEINDNLTKYVKSDVVVTNTGNVYEYVRVNIVGNWVGQLYKGVDENGNAIYESDKTVLNGYINADKDSDGNYTSDRMLEAWNDKDNAERGYYLDKNKQKIDPLYTVNHVNYLMYGTFEGLTPESHIVPATADSTVNGWVRYDKYYYFTRPIGPTEAVTNKLFEKYTVNVSPEFWIPDMWGIRQKAGNVHLEMDLMVQAIPAPVDKDGNVIGNENGDGYINAWVEALGLSDKNELLDLKVKQ